MKQVFLICGARPNFMKVAPIIQQLKVRNKITPILVHTGQHYDHAMSDRFFEELGIPTPDYHLGVGSGTHSVQTAKIMTSFEEICIKNRPDLVLVVGDVNSTLAATLVAKKMGISCAHVEAGLRSNDWNMPEEINRRVTDSITDLFFVTEAEGEANLLREGVDPSHICFAGNVMIDTLVNQIEKAKSVSAYKSYGLKENSFALLTLHRPSNVDDPMVLKGLLGALTNISKKIPILFPIHPRTKQKIAELDEKFQFIEAVENNQTNLTSGIITTPPLSYIDMLSCQCTAAMILTDSGGIQEESTFLGKPCITLRHNTERPITVTEGTNVVVGTDPVKIQEMANLVLSGKWKKGQRPRGWDGHAALRIAERLESFLQIA